MMTKKWWVAVSGIAFLIGGLLVLDPILDPIPKSAAKISARVDWCLAELIDVRLTNDWKTVHAQAQRSGRVHPRNECFVLRIGTPEGYRELAGILERRRNFFGTERLGGTFGITNQFFRWSSPPIWWNLEDTENTIFASQDGISFALTDHETNSVLYLHVAR